MLPVRFHRIPGTHPVFHHHKRFAVTVVQFDQAVPQSLGINLPSPVRRRQIGIAYPQYRVAGGALGVGIGGLCQSHIIAEGDKVHASLFQDRPVLRLHRNVDAFALKHFQDQAGIFAPDLHIGIEQIFQIPGLGGQFIIGAQVRA